MSNENKRTRVKSSQILDRDTFLKIRKEVIALYSSSSFAKCFTTSEPSVESNKFKTYFIEDLKSYSLIKGIKKIPAKTLSSHIFESKQQSIRRSIMHRFRTWFSLMNKSKLYIQKLCKEIEGSTSNLSEFEDLCEKFLKKLTAPEGKYDHPQVNHTLSSENFKNLRHEREAKLIFQFLLEKEDKIYNFLDKCSVRLKIKSENHQNIFMRLSLSYIYSGLAFIETKQDQKFFKSLQTGNNK